MPILYGFLAGFQELSLMDKEGLEGGMIGRNLFFEWTGTATNHPVGQ